MAERVLKWIRGREFNLPLYLIIFLLAYGSLVIIPNGIIDPRIQRTTNFLYGMLVISGFYVLSKISIVTGLFILYVCLISFFTIHYEPNTFYIIFSLIIFYLGIVYTYDCWKNKKEAIYDTLIYLVIINVIYQILQYFHIYILLYPISGTEYQVTGIMSNINDTSAFYALCLPAFFRKNRWFLLPIIIFGLYISATLNGIFASICIAGLYGLINIPIKKYWKWIVLTIVVSIPLLFSYAIYVDKFDLKNQQIGRFFIWKKTIEVASMQPLGWGFSQYDVVMPLLTSFKYLDNPPFLPGTKEYLYKKVINKPVFDKALIKASHGNLQYFFSNKMSKTIFLQAHNEYLEWFFIGGWIGLIMGFFFLLRYLWVGFWQSDRLPFYGLVVSLLTAIFFFTYHITPLALITVLYLSLIEGEKHGDIGFV